MSVVVIDDRSRLTLPKKLGVRKTRAIVIPAGSFIVIIPLLPKPSKSAKDWLKTEKGRDELKKEAEAATRRDAAERARRQKQLAN